MNHCASLCMLSGVAAMAGLCRIERCATHRGVALGPQALKTLVFSFAGECLRTNAGGSAAAIHGG